MDHMTLQEELPVRLSKLNTATHTRGSRSAVASASTLCTQVISVVASLRSFASGQTASFALVRLFLFDPGLRATTLQQVTAWQDNLRAWTMTASRWVGR